MVHLAVPFLVVPVTYFICLMYAGAVGEEQDGNPSTGGLILLILAWILAVVASAIAEGSIAGTATFSIAAGFLAFQAESDMQEKSVWVGPCVVAGAAGLVVSLWCLFTWPPVDTVGQLIGYVPAVLCFAVLSAAGKAGKGDLEVVAAVALLMFPAKDIITGVDFMYGLALGSLFMLLMRAWKLLREEEDVKETAKEKMPMVPYIMAGVLATAIIL